MSVTKDDVVTAIKDKMESTDKVAWETTHEEVKLMLDKVAEYIADFENRLDALEKA